jgi:thiol-disulfide isomerase/thioredoxin
VRTFWAPLIALSVAVLACGLPLGAAAHANEKPKAKAEHGGGEHGGEAAEAAKATEPVASDFYVHRWIPLPAFAGTLLGGEGQATVQARPGHATVILFLASYCESCQQMVGGLVEVARKYERLDVDFVFVFSHDTKDDAEGFMKEHGIAEGVLANFDVLQAYHNPELPTIYVGDRHGWLTTRYPQAGEAALASLDELLKKMTAF